MIVVTGAAGFIGSNVVAALNERGVDDILVCDRLGSDGRWQNLGKRMFTGFAQPEELIARMEKSGAVSAVIHLGAISSTTVTDGDEVMRDNFGMTLALLDWCTAQGVPLLYASSAATYGDGEHGFEDDWSLAALKSLRPLNLYGWSKHQIDLLVAHRHETGKRMPPKCIGMKFFNVFGPNEYHKGEMKSVVAKMTPVVRAGETVSLFKSHRAGIPDGGQKRDFIYVEDVVTVLLWLLDGPVERGIFNLGTGTARSFADLAHATFSALQRAPKIEYVPMPENLRGRYQYFTQASTERLRAAGCEVPFTSLEESVERYVRGFLERDDPYR
jgi:ADP-L-glycero-D-manno-heptose 6-epimerase